MGGLQAAFSCPFSFLFWRRCSAVCSTVWNQIQSLEREPGAAGHWGVGDWMLVRVPVSGSALLALSGVQAIYAELALDECQRRLRAAARCRASTEDPAVARADGACTYTPLSPSVAGGYPGFRRACRLMVCTERAGRRALCGRWRGLWQHEQWPAEKERT
ncbi:hypothetical protein TRAPUB_8180 [Trametes pubescens]|uniref:Uncharacterized protein n=1 Tax=Trametes pubescens TaxID=154538 RepID=A0A1M2W5W8_TRAPU|nr:hypothetical protein TRAPUB_8180 [Trametes pubescens]